MQQGVSDVRVFEDNFIEVKPGWLVDPVVKLMLSTSGHKESGSNDAMLHLGYDPEIRGDRLTVPRSAESRARRLAIPSMAHLADEPIVAQSSKYKRITSLGFEWDEPQSHTLRLRIQEAKYNFSLKSEVFKVEKTPIAFERPNETLLYMVQSLCRMHVVREWEVKNRYPSVDRIEVCVKADVAYGFFGLDERNVAEVEPGWACIASREFR